MFRVITLGALALFCFTATGCSWKQADKLNPFAEEGPDNLGQMSNKAILNDGDTGDGSSGTDQARHALEVMGSYRRTQAPQPTYPVVQPAEVRLMWVPDHLNKAGDLVPAHYYYLKVLPDRWAVQDAFDIEAQLNQGSSGSASGKPWVFGGGGGGR